MSHEEAPSWRLLHHKTVKARTTKVCNMCGGPIETGQHYLSVAALDDGRFKLIRQHLSAPSCAYAQEQAEQFERDRLEIFGGEISADGPNPPRAEIV
jgi:hypothetical protein